MYDQSLIKKIFSVYLISLILGTLPNTIGQTASLTVHSVLGKQSFDIQVKQCKGYRAYFLRQPAICDSAYCFGKIKVTANYSLLVK